MSKQCSQNFINSLKELNGTENKYEGAYFQEEIER